VPYLAYDERRRRIIDAAVKVVASEGFDGLTTRRVAEKARAPLGAMHYCFRSKDELIKLVAERAVAMLQESFADVPSDLGVEATIRQSIAAFWKWFRDNIGLQLALMEFGLSRIRAGGPSNVVYAMWDPFGRDLLRERLERAVKRDQVKLAISIDEIVRFILHRFDGLAYEYGASRDEAACERQTQLLADALVMLALPERAASAAPATPTSRASRAKAKRAARA
jgi:AcrR family transcriptional regulator